jgi:hypothetical protein
MKYILPMIFGLIAGLACGFFIVYLKDDWFKSMGAQIVGGMIVGGIFGGAIGSISGQFNATDDAGSHRILVAVIFGAIGGVLGATKLAVIWETFKYFHWPTPNY